LVVEDLARKLLADEEDAGELALDLERHDEGRADRVELAIRGVEVLGDLGVELDLLLDQQAARPAEPLDDGAVDRDHADGRPLAEVRLFAVDGERVPRDRKSTRLNSSHLGISYAVFCLKKKKKKTKLY